MIYPLHSASDAGYNHKKYSSWQLAVVETCENTKGSGLLLIDDCKNNNLFYRNYIYHQLPLLHKQWPSGLDAGFPI